MSESKYLSLIIKPKTNLLINEKLSYRINFSENGYVKAFRYCQKDFDEAEGREIAFGDFLLKINRICGNTARMNGGVKFNVKVCHVSDWTQDPGIEF